MNNEYTENESQVVINMNYSFVVIRVQTVNQAKTF